MARTWTLMASPTKPRSCPWAISRTGATAMIATMTRLVPPRTSRAARTEAGRSAAAQLASRSRSPVLDRPGDQAPRPSSGRRRDRAATARPAAAKAATETR